MSHPSIDQLVDQARDEYAEDGTLASDTYMALNNAGINADVFMAQLEGELNGQE